MQQSKIEIPLYRWGLPLSPQSNLIVFLILLPWGAVVYLLSDLKFVQEGGWLLLVLIALVDVVVLRYIFAKKEHPEVLPIVYENEAFLFPQNLFPDKTPITLKINEIQEVMIYETASVRGRASWKMVLHLLNGKRILLKIFWTDLKQIEKILQENSVKINKKALPIFFWFYGIMFAVGIGFLIWAFYFRSV